MHRMIVSILMTAVLPAYATEPEPQITIEVKGTAPDAQAAQPERNFILSPKHGTVVHPDGTVEYIPVSAMPTPPVQPYDQNQVDKGGNDLLGGSFAFSTQINDCIAAATTNARKAKLEVVGDIIARCREIAVNQTDANTRHDVAMLALQTDAQMSAQADGAIAVGERPATMLAATNGGFMGSGGAFANWGDQVGQIGWSLDMMGAGLSNGAVSPVVQPPSNPPPPAPVIRASKPQPPSPEAKTAGAIE